MIATLLLLTLTQVEVRLFASNDAELNTAILAQLTDFDITLELTPETEDWEPTEAGQLRQLRRLLLGKPTRVAIWVESMPWRVHVADLWSGQHAQRELVLDSGAREAAALMVRSAVASFVEQDAVAPISHAERFRISAAWHFAKYARELPWSHGPMVEFAWVFSQRFSLWARGRFELTTVLEREAVHLALQRNEVAVGLEAAFHFGRFSIRPRAGLAVRFVRVTPMVASDNYEVAPASTDVGLAALLGSALSMQLIGPLDLVLDAWGAVNLRETRYQIQEAERSVTALRPWGVEGGAALGVAVRF